ncbi:MAG: ATP-binding protein, partial [Deltaproteobacteria bacterium]|nr:ATP-binding protein [Deltaproteobacteria bacterium]
FFLFGPRGSGKSTWIRQRFAGAHRFDLLDEALYQELLVRPAGFADRLRRLKSRSWVCVDEVQRLPALLNEVHRAIEDQGLRFVLSGSSARKLRRAGVNLLGGRALRRTMHPFVPDELEGRFSLESALRDGLLPVVLTSTQPAETLRSYVRSYLKEEIQAEALVKNLGGFARFLPVAALMHGQVVNVSSIARDAGVARTTVNDYLEILEDTLLAFRLPAFETRLRVRERKHPKLYWVDSGLVRAAKDQLGPVAIEERGPLFEGLVAHCLRAWNETHELYDELSYWSATESASAEVDFLLRRGRSFVAIEAKSGVRFRAEDLRGLEAIAPLQGLKRRLLIYAKGPALTTASGIEVMDFEAFNALLAKRRL